MEIFTPPNNSTNLKFEIAKPWLTLYTSVIGVLFAIVGYFMVSTFNGFSDKLEKVNDNLTLLLQQRAMDSKTIEFLLENDRKQDTKIDNLIRELNTKH